MSGVAGVLASHVANQPYSGLRIKIWPEILPIESLQALRNEIIYANRNAFVANPKYTPDSYPWGGGCTYFSPWLRHLSTTPLRELPILTQRVLLHTKKIAPLADLRVIDSMPFIPSFCDIKLGESMFRDARSHFNYNVSSQQLRRMLRLDLSILEECFLSCPRKSKKASVLACFVAL